MDSIAIYDLGKGNCVSLVLQTWDKQQAGTQPNLARVMNT